MVFLHTRSISLLVSLLIIFIITTIHQIPSAFTWRPSTFPARKSSSTQSGLSNPHSYAFATLLAGTSPHTNTSHPDSTIPLTDEEKYVSDNYFTATRILTYQLLHAPETRSRSGIPFLVLLTSSVPQSQLDRLTKDGATIVPVETLRTDWIVPQASRWADVMAKLRLWQLTTYSKILFLDADSIITQCLDDVFDDPAAQTLHTLNNTSNLMFDEAPLPETYLFGGIGQLKFSHAFPPTLENDDYDNANYLNAGFFLIGPNQALFEYYLSLLSLEGRFNPDFPEQNMLNYAHRRDGNLPWKQLDPRWNVMGPTWKDYEAGARSLHEKWWDVPDRPEDGGNLRRVFESWRWRMEGFFEGLDAGREAR
jgi:alpha-N-acetylglucosamine transferase